MLQPSDQVLTVAQMRAAEQALIEQGSSVDALMEKAGSGAAEIVWRMAAGRPVTILCGPGNNGGDGYVLAQCLYKKGLKVYVIAPRPPATDAARNAREGFAGQVYTDAHDAPAGGVFVDCLFGSGLSRPLDREMAHLLLDLFEKSALCVAVDVASGVDADTGASAGSMVPYDCTIALGAWKYAHFSGPAASLAGQLKLVDIGIAARRTGAHRIARPQLQAPWPFAHKFSRGMLAVVAGEMPGASLLAARAAQRAGAGYVRLIADMQPAGLPPSLVLDAQPIDIALEEPRLDALLIGPGLGQGSEARERLAQSLRLQIPTVVDGDALRLLCPGLLGEVEAETLIVTPHEGELKALCASFNVSGATRLEMARNLQAATGMTIIAKGPSTHVHGEADYDGATVTTGLFPPASSWLSVAGSGDVLAGIAASRLSVGEEPFDAACQAVHIHSEAARHCGTAFTADQLADAVAPAVQAFL